MDRKQFIRNLFFLGAGSMLFLREGISFGNTMKDTKVDLDIKTLEIPTENGIIKVHAIPTGTVAVGMISPKPGIRRHADSIRLSMDRSDADLYLGYRTSGRHCSDRYWGKCQRK